MGSLVKKETGECTKSIKWRMVPICVYKRWWRVPHRTNVSGLLQPSIQQKYIFQAGYVHEQDILNTLAAKLKDSGDYPDNGYFMWKEDLDHFFPYHFCCEKMGYISSHLIPQEAWHVRYIINCHWIVIITNTWVAFNMWQLHFSEFSA